MSSLPRHHVRTAAVAAAALTAMALVAPSATAEPDPTGPLADPVAAKIHDIQGTTRISPFDGQQVTDVTGIVTAIRGFGDARGFWLQDPETDDDPRTSEALFVFTGETSPSVAVGDAVSAGGTVKEYYPDSPDTSNFQSLTELSGAQWVVGSSGNALPATKFVDGNSLPEDSAPQVDGNIEGLELDPQRYSLDFWESHESELVGLRDARIVGPTSKYNELYVTTKPEQHATKRGGTTYQGYDEPNTGVVKVESLIPFDERPFPKADTGDLLTGATVGPVEYDGFGGYTVFATEFGEVKDNGLAREATRAQRSGELAVATYNVENLSAVDEQAKFDQLANGVVENLARPDIVTLEEIQDDNGAQAEGDGVVGAEQTLRRFTDTIAAAGGPRYEFRQIDPADLADGGEPGGNIRVGFLFNPERVSFVDRPGGDAATPVGVTAEHGKAALTVSPGRVDPAGGAWQDSRKPLAGEFEFKGRKVFVVANHFASKGGDQPSHGRFQPPTRGSEVQRIAQARSLRGFTDSLLDADPKANVVLAGDLNDYQFSSAVRTLTEGGRFSALIDTLPENERYSYVFEGNSQVLDHLLASKAPRGIDYDIVHVNAEFAEQASDHDPQIVRFRPSAGNPLADGYHDLLDWLEQLTGKPTS